MCIGILLSDGVNAELKAVIIGILLADADLTGMLGGVATNDEVTGTLNRGVIVDVKIAVCIGVLLADADLTMSGGVAANDEVTGALNREVVVDVGVLLTGAKFSDAIEPVNDAELLNMIGMVLVDMELVGMLVIDGGSLGVLVGLRAIDGGEVIGALNRVVVVNAESVDVYIKPWLMDVDFTNKLVWVMTNDVELGLLVEILFIDATLLGVLARSVVISGEEASGALDKEVVLDGETINVYVEVLLIDGDFTIVLVRVVVVDAKLLDAMFGALLSDVEGPGIVVGVVTGDITGVSN